MKICFVTAGPIEWASSRMRAFWVAESLKERGHEVSVESYQHVIDNGILIEPEIVIWQKNAAAGLISWHKEHHKHQRHYWDVCDPAWWWQPNECREIAANVNGVVASSPALADDFNEWLGQDMATCIPDRLKLSHFHTQRIHQTVTPVRFIWFGIAANRIALWAAKAPLERLVANGYRIELTILDDRPDAPFRFSDAFPIYHTQWTLDSEVEVISRHDVALLPPYPGPWGEVKSNNKVLTAFACGLPSFTARHYAAAVESMTVEGRQRQTSARPDDFWQQREIAQSAIEWEALCS